MPDLASLLGPARDKATRGDIAIHDHVCGIYETREEQYGPACQFLKLGLERNEQCLYISEELSPAEFGTLLETHGVDVKRAVAAGSLRIASGREIRDGELEGFTPDAMLAFLSRAEQTALTGGFAAFRWAAEMTWLRKDYISPADVFLFEAELNRFLPGHRLAAMCSYAMVDFPAELLIAAAETHPLLLYSTVVCDNFYFIPAEEYLKPGFSDMKLKRLLGNIITRERLMQNFLSVSAPA